MKVEGDVKSVVDKTTLITKFQVVPEVGATILDKKKKEIGEVTWIFGPTQDPYIEVNLHSDTKKRLSILNEKLYLEEI